MAGSSDSHALLKWWPILAVVGAGIMAFAVNQFRIDATAGELKRIETEVNGEIKEVEGIAKDNTRGINILRSEVQQKNGEIALELQKLRLNQEASQREQKQLLEQILRNQGKP